MSSQKQPVTIKKYANRRLYNTGTSAYVTLEDLAAMVKIGDDFVVFDAKTGEEITRSVLAQIIFEQEGKSGQSMLPIAFLRQLIRFYGDSLQTLVPRYLEFSIDRLTDDQKRMRELMASPFTGKGPALGAQMFEPLEEQARKNMAMFTQALAMFNPFVAAAAKPEEPAPAPPPPAADLDDMKKQLGAMQKRLDELAKKS